MKKYTLQELRTKGTDLSELSGIINLTDSQMRTNSTRALDLNNHIVNPMSFGTTSRHSEEHILVESREYTGPWFYEIPVSEFRRLGLLDEFVLPEKWCVKGTKDKVVQQFFLTYKDNRLDDFVSHASYENWYFYSEYAPEKSVKHYCSDKLHKGFTEITFEQFKNYVLKENNMKEIVSYKLNKPEFKDAVHAICKNIKWSGYPILLPSSSYFNDIKNAGVLDLWFTPIYEEDRVKKIGKWDVSFNVDLEATVKVGCGYYSKHSLEQARDILQLENVKAIQCLEHNLTLADVNNLLKYFE